MHPIIKPFSAILNCHEFAEEHRMVYSINGLKFVCSEMLRCHPTGIAKNSEMQQFFPPRHILRTFQTATPLLVAATERGDVDKNKELFI